MRHRTLAAGLIVFGLVAGAARVALVTPRPHAGGANRAIFSEAEPLRGQKNTQVEPDSFVWGAKLVTTFQAWRISDGGSDELAWATSADGGSHWRTGTLPLGVYDAASDSVVTFDAAHHVWLISGIGFRGPRIDVFVARSPDGVHWGSAPVVAADDVDEDYDKEWIGCDNGARSRFRGRCYLAYVDTSRWLLGIRTSDDGGLTWSKPQRLQPGVQGPGAVFSGPVPVTRPNGDLVVPYSFFAPLGPGGSAQQEDRVAAVVSHDGGATFTPPIRIAALEAADDAAGIRAPALPSVTVDAAGTLYVAWQDGRFRRTGDDNDIVFATSRNGTRWSEPARIPLSRAPTYFLPAIAVDPATSGRNAHLAVAYYSHRPRPGCTIFFPGCYEQIDAWLVQSHNAGRTWERPQRLNAQPMRVEWLAQTALGGMLGDYISVSFVRGRPVPVIALAKPPSAAGQSESIFTCRVKIPAPRAETKVSSSCRRPSP